MFLAHSICSTMMFKELGLFVSSCGLVTAGGGNWWVLVDQSQPPKLITNDKLLNFKLPNQSLLSLNRNLQGNTK